MPTPPPWDSPNVVIRNRCPKVLPIVSASRDRELWRDLEKCSVVYCSKVWGGARTYDRSQVRGDRLWRDRLPELRSVTCGLSQYASHRSTTKKGSLQSSNESQTMQPIQTKQDVLASVRANHQTLQTYGVDRLGIFGSFQRDE
ncbi:MAG: hypothetical protein HC795_13440 [Coleofasciculaceae cyanobacterium RL_1_1]|nr:hypothetical protein [Coleofasciculaceae cyanobacterium RL_1_1]